MGYNVETHQETQRGPDGRRVVIERAHIEHADLGDHADIADALIEVRAEHPGQSEVEILEADGYSIVEHL